MIPNLTCFAPVTLDGNASSRLFSTVSAMGLSSLFICSTRHRFSDDTWLLYWKGATQTSHCQQYMPDHMAFLVEYILIERLIVDASGQEMHANL